MGTLPPFDRILERKDIRVTSTCSAEEILVNIPAEFLRPYYLSWSPDIGRPILVTRSGHAQPSAGRATGEGVRDNGVIHPIARAGVAA